MEGTVQAVDPFACRMWQCHDRLEEFIDEESCREVVASFIKDGQKHPVLARPCKSSDAKYELIYGARRLFAARCLNTTLLAAIRDLDDRQAFIEMDVENRLRHDISPYERGMAFKSWLRSGHFTSQEGIAKTLGLSTAHVSRLMKFAELPTAVVMAFRDPRQIKEAWAATLAERCTNPNIKEQTLRVARSLLKRRDSFCEAGEVYRSLLDYKDAPRAARPSSRDQVVRAKDGRPLFRISHRHNDLHIIIRRDTAPTDVLRELTDALTSVFVRVLLKAPLLQGVPESPDSSSSAVRFAHVRRAAHSGNGCAG